MAKSLWTPAAPVRIQGTLYVTVDTHDVALYELTA